jgi:hypothetical protein
MPKEAKPKLLTVAEYAAHRRAKGLPGATKPSVYKAIATGRIAHVSDEQARAFRAERDQDARP